MVVSAYRLMTRARFGGAWDEPIAFRGARFSIGEDLTLYPAVRNGGFEALELDALLPLIGESDHVWDVGANVGIYSVLLGRAAALGTVCAFEPVEASRERLVRNLALNGTTNVTVEAFGLSDRSGVQTMAIHDDAHGCDQIVDPAEAGEDASHVVEVATRTGDDYVGTHGFGDPDIIKVDIEGHEPEFIAGSWGVLERRRPLLFMEVNPTAWAPHRFAVWDQTLERLFGLYGTGEWFDSAGSRTVRSIEVDTLGPHAYMLLFGAPSR